ncbi:conserved hypothetical protein [Histoplasma capsulatum var. duboisii H88]|uniref:Uncharacterized protein n=1 Tax=Ajellomyces capsulatus (strain H88) TaxID=544711 RepID=F0U675_AJEC8|nr:conserved hypothetical protein [Histoplasma capsulatum var. duboisii H88]
MDKASIQFKHDLMQSMTCSLSGIEFGISCVASKIITDRPPDSSLQAELSDHLTLLAQAKPLLEMILELSHAAQRRQQTHDTDNPNRPFPRISIPNAPKDLVVLVRGDSKTPGVS